GSEGGREVGAGGHRCPLTLLPRQGFGRHEDVDQRDRPPRLLTPLMGLGETQAWRGTLPPKVRESWAPRAACAAPWSRSGQFGLSRAPTRDPAAVRPATEAWGNSSLNSSNPHSTFPETGSRPRSRGRWCRSFPSLVRRI